MIKIQIMNKVVYQKLVFEQLNSNSYSRCVIAERLIIGLKLQNDSILDELINQNIANKKDANIARVKDTLIPNFYGLLKDHKDNLNIRPVINTKNSIEWVLC